MQQAVGVASAFVLTACIHDISLLQAMLMRQVKWSMTVMLMPILISSGLLLICPLLLQCFCVSATSSVCLFLALVLLSMMCVATLVTTLASMSFRTYQSCSKPHGIKRHHASESIDLCIQHCLSAAIQMCTSGCHCLLVSADESTF